MSVIMRTSEVSEQAEAVQIRAKVRGLRLFLSFVLIVSFCLEFVFWAAFLLSPLRNRTDFRQLYVAGYMARSGHLHQLYDLELQYSFENALVSPEPSVLPFIRPSYAALWFAPFSLLPYKYAYFAWFFLNVVLLVLSLLLLSRGVRWSELEIWVAPAMFLLFLPVQIALMQGQDSILLLMLFSSAFVFLSQKRECAAGMVSALGMFKFQLVLPIALLFLLKRRWKFVGGFTSVSAVLCCLSVSLVGVTQAKLYLDLLGTISAGSSGHNSIGDAVSWTNMATLRGLIFGLVSSQLSRRLVQFSVVLLSAALILLVSVLVPKIRSSAELFPVFIVTGILIGYYIFAHDLSILLIPILLVLGDAARNPSSPWLGYSAAALFSAPLFTFLMPHHFYLVSLILLEFLFATMWAIRHRTPLLGEPYK